MDFHKATGIEGLKWDNLGRQSKSVLGCDWLAIPTKHARDVYPEWKHVIFGNSLFKKNEITT